MNSISPLADQAAQASTLVSNILSSIQSSYGPNSQTEGLFANLLSQYEIPGLSSTSNAPSNASLSSTDETSPAETEAGIEASQADARGAAARSLESQSSAANPPTSDTSSQKVLTANKANEGKNSETDTGNSSTGATSQNDSTQKLPATTSLGSQKNSSQTVSKTSSSSQSLGQDTDATGPNAAGFVNLGRETATDAKAAATSTLAAANASTSKETDPSEDADSSSSDATPSQGTDLTTAAALLLSQLSATSSKASAAGTTPGGSNLLTLLEQLDALANSGQLIKNGTADTSGLLQGSLAQGAASGAKSDASSSGGGLQKAELKGLFASIAGIEDSSDTDATATPGSTAGTSVATSQSATTGSSATTSKSSADKAATDNFLSLFNLQPTADAQGAVVATPPAAIPLLALATSANAEGDTSGTQQGLSVVENAAGGSQQDTAPTSLPTGLSQTSNPYDFASQLSAARAEKGGQTGLPPVIDQVMLQLSRNASKDGSSDMTIQLKPAELGRVDVKLSINSDGKVQGTVTADNSTTLGMLVKDQRGLERALQEAGLHTDPGSLQFSLRGDQQNSGQGQSFGNSSNNSGNTTSSLDVAASTPSTDQTDTYYLTPGGVNMSV